MGKANREETSRKLENPVWPGILAIHTVPISIFYKGIELKLDPGPLPLAECWDRVMKFLMIQCVEDWFVLPPGEHSFHHAPSKGPEPQQKRHAVVSLNLFRCHNFICWSIPQGGSWVRYSQFCIFITDLNVPLVIEGQPSSIYNPSITVFFSGVVRQCYSLAFWQNLLLSEVLQQSD